MFTLTRSNVHDAAPLARFLSGLGVWRFIVRPCVAVGRADESFVPTEEDIWIAYRDILRISDRLKDDFIEWSSVNPYPSMRIWADSPYTMVEESGRHITVLADGTSVIDFCKGITGDNYVGNAFKDDLGEMVQRINDLSKGQPTLESVPPLKILLFGTAMVRAESVKRDSYSRDRIERKFLAPPFGTYRIEHFLRKRFKKEIKKGRLVIDVVDPALATATGKLPELLSQVESGGYHIIGFSPVRVLMGEDLIFMNQVYERAVAFGKRPLFLAGGNEASTDGRLLFQMMPWLDYCVWGVGEPVMEKFIGKMLKDPSRKLRREDFQRIPGVIYPSGLGVHTNRYRLSKEAMSAYSDYPGTNIPYEKYWEYGRSISPGKDPVPLARVYTSHYCPRFCAFCSGNPIGREVFGGNFATLSVRQIAEIIRTACRESGAGAIYFNDEEMFSDKKRGKEVLREIIRMKKEGRIPPQTQFLGQTRTDQVDEELLDLVKEAGFAWLSYGVESLSDLSLSARDITKGVRSDVSYNAVLNTIKRMPVTNMNLILFHPTVTRKGIITTIERTSELIREALEAGNRLSINSFPLLEAYPGARINRIAAEEGWPVEKETISYGGRTWEYASSYLPIDIEIRKLVENGRFLKEFDAVMDEISRDPRMPVTPIARTLGINSIVMFIAAHRLLDVKQGESKISAEGLKDLIWALIDKFQSPKRAASEDITRPTVSAAESEAGNEDPFTTGRAVSVTGGGKDALKDGLAATASVPSGKAEQTAGPAALEDMTPKEYASETRVIRATVHLTNRCNLKCPYCGLESRANLKKPDPSLEEAKKVITAFAKHGVRRLDFTGGEIFLNKDLYDVLEFASAQNVSIGLITNATLIDEEAAKKLAKYRIHSIKISLDGLRETNDLTRGKGSFDKVVKAIGLIKKHTDIPVKIMFTLTRNNVHDAAPLAKFLSGLGVWRFIVRPCVAVGRADESFVPTEEDIWIAYRDILRISDGLKEDFIEWSSVNPYPSMKIWADSPYTMVEESGRHITVLADGTSVIDFCKGITGDNKLGNAFTEDIEEMIENVHQRTSKANLPVILEKELDWNPFDYSAGSTDFQSVPCRMCGRIDYEPVKSIVLHDDKARQDGSRLSKEFMIVRCKHDGFMWLTPEPAPAAAERMYSDPKYFGESRLWVEEGDLKTWRQLARYGYAANYSREKRVDVFKKRLANLIEAGHLKTSDDVLDLGAGKGFMFEVMKEMGWPKDKLLGIDISDVAVRDMMLKGFYVMAGTVDRPLPYTNDSFDVVFMYDLFEHIYEPLGLLKELKRVLRKNGRIVLGIPLCGDNGPDFIRSLEHTNYFTRETITRMLGQAGFEVASFEINKVNYGPDCLSDNATIIARSLPVTSAASAAQVPSRNISPARRMTEKERVAEEDEKYMERLLRFAERRVEKNAEAPFFALLVNEDVHDSLLGLRRPVPGIRKEYQMQDHCEMSALRKAAERGWDLKKCTLYVTTESCYDCAKAIATNFNIKRVVFGSFDPSQRGRGIEVLRSVGIQCAITSEKLRGRASELMRHQFEKLTFRAKLPNSAFAKAKEDPKSILQPLLENPALYENDYMHIFDWAVYWILHRNSRLNSQEWSQVCALNANRVYVKEGAASVPPGKNDTDDAIRQLYRHKSHRYVINDKALRTVLIGTESNCERIAKGILDAKVLEEEQLYILTDLDGVPLPYREFLAGISHSDRDNILNVPDNRILGDVDYDIRTHTLRCLGYAMLIAHELRVRKKDIQILRQAILAHDIGQSGKYLLDLREALDDINAKCNDVVNHPLSERVEPVSKYLQIWLETKAATYDIPPERVKEAQTQIKRNDYYPAWSLYVAYAVLKKPELNAAEESVARVIFSHGTNSAIMLGSKNFSHTPELEEIKLLISHHHDYGQLDRRLDEMVQRGVIERQRADILRLLASIMIVADGFEQGNNYDRLVGKKKRKRVETFPETFAFLAKRFEQMEDIEEIRPREALKLLLGRRDEQLFALIADGRKSDKLAQEDESFIRECAFATLPTVLIGIIGSTRRVKRAIRQTVGNKGMAQIMKAADASEVIKAAREKGLVPIVIKAYDLPRPSSDEFRHAVDSAIINATAVHGIYRSVHDKIADIEKNLQLLAAQSPEASHDHYSAELMLFLLFGRRLERELYSSAPLQNINVGELEGMYKRLQYANPQGKDIIDTLARELYLARTQRDMPLPDRIEIEGRVALLDAAGIAVNDPDIARLFTMKSEDLKRKTARRRETRAWMIAAQAPRSAVTIAFLDWDGTVVNTSDLTAEAFAYIYPRLMPGGKREEGLKVYQRLDGLSLPKQYAYLAGLAKKKGMRLRMLPSVYEKEFLSVKLQLQAGKIDLIKGADRFFKRLHGQGVEIYIVSGMRYDAIKEEVRRSGFNDLVSGVFGSPSNDAERASFPCSKEEYMKQVLNKRGVSPRKAVMFGDTPNDMRSAKQAGVMPVGRSKNSRTDAVLGAAGAAMLLRDYENASRVQKSIEHQLTERIYRLAHPSPRSIMDVPDAELLGSPSFEINELNRQHLQRVIAIFDILWSLGCDAGPESDHYRIIFRKFLIASAMGGLYGTVGMIGAFPFLDREDEVLLKNGITIPHEIELLLKKMPSGVRDKKGHELLVSLFKNKVSAFMEIDTALLDEDPAANEKKKAWLKKMYAYFAVASSIEAGADHLRKVEVRVKRGESPRPFETIGESFDIIEQNFRESGINLGDYVDKKVAGALKDNSSADHVRIKQITYEAARPVSLPVDTAEAGAADQQEPHAFKALSGWSLLGLGGGIDWVALPAAAFGFISHYTAAHWSELSYFAAGCGVMSAIIALMFAVTSFMRVKAVVKAVRTVHPEFSLWQALRHDIGHDNAAMIELAAISETAFRQISYHELFSSHVDGLTAFIPVLPKGGRKAAESAMSGIFTSRTSGEAEKIFAEAKGLLSEEQRKDAQRVIDALRGSEEAWSTVIHAKDASEITDEAIAKLTDLARVRAARAMREELLKKRPALPSVVIGMPSYSSDAVIAALKETLGQDLRIVTAPDSDAFTGLVGGEKTAGIWIDGSVKLDDMRSAGLKEMVSSIAKEAQAKFLWHINECSIKDKTRQELVAILKAVAANLEKIGKADIDADVKLALTQDNARYMDRARVLVDARKKEIGQAYNNMPMPASYARNMVIATTETVAENDPFTFDNMAKAQEKGIANVFIYGERLKTLEAAQDFMKACGYTKDMGTIRFINKKDFASYQSLVEGIKAQVSLDSGAAIELANIGIRAAEGELLKAGEKPAAGRFLEIPLVKVNGIEVYAALNTYQTLIALVTKLKEPGMTLEDVRIPDVSYDKAKGIFKFLPRSLPIDYGIEIESYRNAVKALSTAA
ncbi:MAG: radical SAM protein [Candidatus Omnitrophica bacterium]|nr:radical SAM protein [Candidatus Omnitrophota bacterium]